MRPSFTVPADATDKEVGVVVLVAVVSVEEHHITLWGGYHCAVARSGILVVSAHYDSSAAFHKRSAVLVIVRSVDGVRPSYHHLVSALGAAAAQVIGYEQIVFAVPLDDERCLDRSVAGIEVFASWVSRDGVIRLGSVLGCAFRPSANGEPLLRFGDLGEGRVQLHHLDSSPERTEGKPCASVIIHENVGVDRVPFVPSCHAPYHASVVFPFVVGGGGVEGLVCSDAYR